MELSTAALRTMGESASDGISPYAWGPALINAADQIDRLRPALEGLLEEFAARCEDRKSRYVSPNGVCAYDNAIAALKG